MLFAAVNLVGALEPLLQMKAAASAMQKCFAEHETQTTTVSLSKADKQSDCNFLAATRPKSEIACKGGGWRGGDDVRATACPSQ